MHLYWTSVWSLILIDPQLFVIMSNLRKINLLCVLVDLFCASWDFYRLTQISIWFNASIIYKTKLSILNIRLKKEGSSGPLKATELKVRVHWIQMLCRGWIVSDTTRSKTMPVLCHAATKTTCLLHVTPLTSFKTIRDSCRWRETRVKKCLLCRKYLR